jgi:crotonobetainyl-CoA:carnitine CoA-transferase CaiB-like acyl-CoA transferase
MHGAIAVLAALRHRRRTGEGQVIELSQAETSAAMFPQSAIDAAWNGNVHGSIGNRSIEGFVPNGVFPTAGNDEWIALSCRSDAEWAALVGFMGAPARRPGRWRRSSRRLSGERRTKTQSKRESASGRRRRSAARCSGGCRPPG